jgi:hypothetical protein
MGLIIDYTPEFLRKSKRYTKKYKSFKNDLKRFIDNLDNETGINIAGCVYKYRLAVKSKNKGKRGGFRVITHEIIIKNKNKEKITLITIWDKNEQENISDKEIKDIINNNDLK